MFKFSQTSCLLFLIVLILCKGCCRGEKSKGWEGDIDKTLDVLEKMQKVLDTMNNMKIPSGWGIN